MGCECLSKAVLKLPEFNIKEWKDTKSKKMLNMTIQKILLDIFRDFKASKDWILLQLWRYLPWNFIPTPPLDDFPFEFIETALLVSLLLLILLLLVARELPKINKTTAIYNYAKKELCLHGKDNSTNALNKLVWCIYYICLDFF